MAFINHCSSGTHDNFFAPLQGLAQGSSRRRDCTAVPDDLWLQIGIFRTIALCDSGRDLLQQLADEKDIDVLTSTFFESLKSERRAALLGDVLGAVRKLADARLPDPFAAFPELAGFHLHAGDGHFIGASTHDSRDADGRRFPVGHLYTLNLRSHAANHLCVSDQAARRQEHDMRALKRQDLATLRQGAKDGTKVLYVWDKAGYSGPQWETWKKRGGVYFLSRQKDSLKLRVVAAHPVDHADPVNWGVRADEDVVTAAGQPMRRVAFHDKESGRDYIYLTNLPRKIRPGVVALLYKSRWDIEKVFDEFKNKLGETKAWAASATAKTVQARFLCLTHNLMLLLEEQIRRDTGITNQAEERRRAAEVLKRDLRLRAEGQGGLHPMVRCVQRLTQRAVKFIRWLRHHLDSPRPWDQALARLAKIYATL